MKEIEKMWMNVCQNKQGIGFGKKKNKEKGESQKEEIMELDSITDYRGSWCPCYC